MRQWGMEIILFFVVVIWGINYTIGKYGTMEITSIEFTTIRFFISAPILLLITVLIERSLFIAKKDFIRLFFVSTVGITLYQSLFMETIKYISATNASLLISISPIFTTIFTLFLKQETFSRQKWLGSLLAFAGAALVLLEGNDSGVPHQNILFGNIMGMIASISWGLYPILATPLIKKYSALRVTAWSAAIAIVPLFLLSGSNVLLLPFSLNETTWLSLSYSVFFVTIFGLVSWYIGVQKIGATNTMVYMYVTPLAAVVFAAFWANEHISLQQVIGGIIIFVGLWVVKKKKTIQISESKSH